jgi:hypothetical protein
VVVAMVVLSWCLWSGAAEARVTRESIALGQPEHQPADPVLFFLGFPPCLDPRNRVLRSAIGVRSPPASRIRQNTQPFVAGSSVVLST